MAGTLRSVTSTPLPIGNVESPFHIEGHSGICKRPHNLLRGWDVRTEFLGYEFRRRLRPRGRIGCRGGGWGGNSRRSAVGGGPDLLWVGPQDDADSAGAARGHD